MAGTRRDQIWIRAAGRCEYCQMPQAFDVRPFQIDHVRAQKHRGDSGLSNTALSCLPCNAYKGPNVAGYDPELNRLQRLFNPRLDEWHDHSRGMVRFSPGRPPSAERRSKFCGSMHRIE